MKLVKRKKNSRAKGKRTHGWGSKKKRRGGGSRGGSGHSGSDKHHYVKRVVEEQSHLGKKGFYSLKKHERTINICELPDRNEINLKEMGYEKLLGRGTIKKAVIVKAGKCSKKAMEKIEKAGGKVVITSSLSNDN
ncbi:MAG: uL15 family ribosomal protein [Candidatus Aenigmarchaeota archaeon]|nr:uL15 family ribosomal protein [Candidatus Aenigmarchaeota archaeon]